MNQQRNNCCKRTNFEWCWKRQALVFTLIMINTASEVVKAVVEPCPSRCICLSDTKVLCNGAGLSHVPEDLPIMVEELSFSKNELETLEKEMFSTWRRLKVLSLDHNKIRKLHPFIFKGLPHLRELSIQNNPLTVLPQFSFSGIENISQIDLRNNKIEIIDPYVFTGSKNIAMLFLQGNPIQRIRSRAFSGLRTVQFLYLPSWIKIIEPDAFYDLQGIGLLRLHSLDLHCLGPYTFRGLQNVTQISIQESDLGTLMTLAFSGMQNIGELRIINNKVDILESLTVCQPSNVDGIVVRGNHFLTVKSEGEILDLQANERNLILENFFPCNCQLNWIMSSHSARSTASFPLHNYCVSPYSLHGKTIDSVNISALSPCLAPQELLGSGPQTAILNAAAGSAKPLERKLYMMASCFVHVFCYVLVVYEW